MKTLENNVKNAQTNTVEGRQLVANACKELYNLIEAGLHAKYGDAAVNDAYSDLCNGNFAEPFMCEKKKQKFTLYRSIANSLN